MNRDMQDRINNIPSNEQQKYIQANMELRSLMTKEILADDVYERMYEEVIKNNDLKQIEQFENSHIKESVYDNDIDKLGSIISEIDNKYGFTNEELNQEFDSEVKMKRDRLSKIKSYYEHNGSYIMRNINVDTLTDNEVMDMYEQIESGIGYDRVINMVNDMNNLEVERERDKRLDPVRQRVERFRTPKGVLDGASQAGDSTVGSNNDNGSTGEDSGTNDSDVVPESQVIEHTDTERKVKELKEDFDRVNEDINKINAKLILNQDLSNEVNEEIRKIDNDVKELVKDANEIISDLDNFKEKYEQADFTMNYQEITEELKNIKDKLKRLKQEQIKSYNNSVESVNKAIEELKRLNTSEIDSKLENVDLLDRCNTNISQWQDSVSYLDDIDYDKLIDTNRVLYEIYNAKNNGNIDEEEVNNKDNEWSITMLELYTDIENIEDEINNIESEFTEIMPENDINRLRDSIKNCSDNVNAFRAKLDNNRDKLDIDDYNALEDRCNSAEEELMDLNSVLNEKGLNNASISVNNKDIYEELMRRLIALKGNVANLDLLSDSLNGLMNKDTVDKYRDLLNNRYIIDLQDLKQDIESKYRSKKLDDNQYNNLVKEIEELEELVKGLNEKLRDPGMIREADIFSVLNGEIDGLESALDKLEGQINSLDKPIKREDRKNIDRIVRQLENEIKRITKLLEQYKDKDPDKYNKLINRLDDVNNRLNNIKKDYRKKCPLLVRSVKSAKEFYKRHKKTVLIIAGLSAFAMLGQNVLIPAIVHGNMMIWENVPAMRGIIEIFNKTLGTFGGLIKGSVGESWYTANGVLINPSVAASSLLKGLAISGIGSTALVAPLVVAVKKLTEKMKMGELKKKLQEEKEKKEKKKKEKEEELKNKLNNGKEKVKNTANKGKDKAKEELNKAKEQLINAKKKAKRSIPNYYDKVADLYTFDGVDDGVDVKYGIEENYRRYKKSGMPLDQFAKKEELSENDIAVFKYIDNNFKDYIFYELRTMIRNYRKSGMSPEEYIEDAKLDNEDEEVFRNLLGCINNTKEEYDLYNIGEKIKRRI